MVAFGPGTYTVGNRYPSVRPGSPRRVSQPIALMNENLYPKWVWVGATLLVWIFLSVPFPPSFPDVETDRPCQFFFLRLPVCGKAAVKFLTQIVGTVDVDAKGVRPAVLPVHALGWLQGNVL